MKNNKITVGAAALVAIIATAGMTASTFAYHGDPSVKGPNVDTKTHEAMTDAFENRDYNSWKANKPNEAKGRMMDVVKDKATFTKFAEMREARMAGDTDRAEDLRTELGLGQRNGEGYRQGMKGSGSRGQGNAEKGLRGENKGTRGQNHNVNFVDVNNNICDLAE